MKTKNKVNFRQECGSRVASAFGGSSNNTNASACSLNGNNSVANSDRNYAASFSLYYYQTDRENSDLDLCTFDSTTGKVEKIVTTADSKKAAVPVSRAVPEMEQGKDWLPSPDLTLGPGIERRYEQPACCMSKSAESRKEIRLFGGLKTFGKHKRLRNMKAFLADPDLIRIAIHEAKKNKKVTPQLTYIMHHVEETVAQIRKEILEETYEPQPYRFRTIRNKEEKPRHLAILGFYDRCVQQLFKLVIQDKLRAMEPRNVYSNLPERGTLSGHSTYCLYGQLRRDFKLFKDGYGLKMDIHHCYESISTKVIMEELFKYVSDNFARRLVERMFHHIKYLPIGDPLSGLYVNLVLRQWHMHLLNEMHHCFDRCYFFCDDSLFINKDNKRLLHSLCHESRAWLLEHTGLHIKANYQVYKLSEGITFCGARIFPEKTLVRQFVKKRMIKAKNKPRSLASYKGILDKTSSAHLTACLGVNEAIHTLKHKKHYANVSV